MQRFMLGHICHQLGGFGGSLEEKLQGVPKDSASLGPPFVVRRNLKASFGVELLVEPVKKNS